MVTITSESIKRVLNQEFGTSIDGSQWKRKIRSDGTKSKWTPVSTELNREESQPLLLMLVILNQAEGEPTHWSLFVAAEGQPGSVYQVTGDATQMHYAFEEKSNIVTSESYNRSYVVAQLGEDGEDLVRSCAENEPPPHAVNRASVKENCQGWTVRVMERLQEAGIVAESWVTLARGMLEPV